jgi:DNA replication ATP-dependent helicase Dna2
MPPADPTDTQLSELNKRFSTQISHLNLEQQMAVLKCIATQDYHMVLGTPGSGKTEVIVTLLQILASMRQKVFLVSYTNQAIDNVLTRLLDKGFT